MHSTDAYYLTYDTGVSNLALEKTVSKNNYYSLCYAIDVLKGRFKLGEKSIEHVNIKIYCFEILRYNHE